MRMLDYPIQNYCIPTRIIIKKKKEEFRYICGSCGEEECTCNINGIKCDDIIKHLSKFNTNNIFKNLFSKSF